MLNNYLIHKRNTSQSIKINSKPKNISSTIYSSSKHNKNANCKSNTLSLIQKSTKKLSNKQTVIQQLDSSQQNNQPAGNFFAFGHKANTHQHKNWNLLDVDKITQVQDSATRRDFTSHRSARQPQQHSYRDKQNYNTSNIHINPNAQQNFRKSTKSKSKPNKSKQRSNKSNKSRSRNQKTKSTISLSRIRNSNISTKQKQKDYNKQRELELRTQKMEKSVKMLWECMGQLWESSRVSQYKSEKNNQSINGLKRKIEEQQQKLLQIKFQISKVLKNNEKSLLNLRA